MPNLRWFTGFPETFELLFLIISISCMRHKIKFLVQCDDILCFNFWAGRVSKAGCDYIFFYPMIYRKQPFYLYKVRIRYAYALSSWNLTCRIILTKLLLLLHLLSGLGTRPEFISNMFYVFILILTQIMTLNKTTVNFWAIRTSFWVSLT